MAFWEVDVKPGKPFTHEYYNSKGRLHISMATLGFGSATARSTLQCNVGNRSPVYLCSLYPGNTESLQLNLEPEEVDRVIFNVIGPRSIHLCGYYLGCRGTARIPDDNSESYGEDIAGTETERSNYSDEDDYEDSFIDDDGDPEVFPPSPISREEEASHGCRPKGRKSSLRRLSRKYQAVESDDDGGLEEKIVMDDQTKEIGNEDSQPISSLLRNKATQRVLDQEMDDSGDRGACDGSNKNGEDGSNSIIQNDLANGNVLVNSQTHREAALADHFIDPCTVLDVGDIKRLKKKKKGKEKETKSSFNGHSLKLENTAQDEPKMDEMTTDLLAGNEQNQEHADDKETVTMDKILPSSEVGHGQGEKPKKKRKKGPKEGVFFSANDAYYDSNLVNLPQRNEHNKKPTVNEDVEISDNVALPSAEKDSKKSRAKRRNKGRVDKGSDLEGVNGYPEDIVEYKANRNTAESDNLLHKFSVGKEEHQKLTNEKNVDDGAHDFPDENQNEERVKKRKKKSKSQGNIEVNAELPLSVEESSERANAKHSQVRALSNGLVIQELEMGKKDGKIAASGRKISVHYTGKLKENGEVFESNAGQAPFKFRLGKGVVIEG